MRQGPNQGLSMLLISINIQPISSGYTMLAIVEWLDECMPFCNSSNEIDSLGTAGDGDVAMQGLVYLKSLSISGTP